MNKLHLARTLTLSAYFNLLILVTVWHAWLYPSAYFPVALVLLVTAVPLLLPLRGLLHGRPASHLWTSFLMLLYFMHGVVEATANPVQRFPALLEVLFSLLVFLAAAFYTRWAMAAVGQAPAT